MTNRFPLAPASLLFSAALTSPPLLAYDIAVQDLIEDSDPQLLRDPMSKRYHDLVKGWLGADGEGQERIYDIAVSDGREIGVDGRCKTPVGDTVDLDNARYTNSIGDAVLAAYWEDPEFDPAQSAFYYVRVLEIPTPSRLVYDRKVYGIEIPEGAVLKEQERAYTSPIWYTPEAVGAEVQGPSAEG
ncbi:MAG: DUF3604 domain-containing protein [Thiohalocapsa sp.]|jgi:hypothetical protein